MFLRALTWGLPLVTGLGMVFLAGYVWRRRTVAGAYALAGTLAAIAFWCVTHGMEARSTTLDSHQLWCHIQFPSIVFLPLFFLILACEYTGRPMRTRNALLLAAGPAAFSIMHWSDAWTHLYWTRTWLERSGPFTTLGRVYGPGFWVYMAYCNVLTLAGVVLLFRRARNQTGIARRRTMVFLGSACFPWVVNTAYVFNIIPWPHVDLTPYSFVVTGLGMTLAVFQYRFQSITPIAWKAAVESLRDAVVVIDAEGRIEDLNAAACVLLGASRRDLKGQTAEQAFADYPGLAACLVSDQDVDLVRDHRTFQARGASVFGRRKHDVVGRLVTVRDVTDETETMRVLKESREAAEQAAVAKARFLATMSHEIRTPMNGVMGMADLLLHMELSDEQREYALAILQSGRSLLHILNDVLDYSKIEAGRLELEQVPFTFEDLLEEIHRLMEPLARKRGLEFTVQSQPIPGRVTGDPGRIRQILLNLVGNALKFTERGSVAIAFEARERAGYLDCAVSVTDTGIGIPPDRIARLFQEFSQVDASTSRRFGGTGLGLAICRRLADAMQAKISVESTPGAGSKFTLRMKLKPSIDPRSSDGPEDGTGKLVSCRVLLAEDNRINQRVATRMLERLGCTVRVAEDGLEAVRTAREETFDIIFMDCDMPGLDGLMATMRLRKEGNATPVIAITASVLAETREACRVAGMDDFLSKPIDSGELAPLLRKWQRAARQVPE